MRKLKRINLFIFLIILLSYGFIHKFYVSVVTIEYNKLNKTLEITTQVFVDDIELMFRNKNINLNLYSESKIRVDSLLKDYFKSVFKIKKGKDILAYNFLGKEYYDDILNCYIEVNDVNINDSLILENRLLIEIFDSQKNIVHFKGKNNNKSFLMNNNKTQIELILSEFE